MKIGLAFAIACTSSPPPPHGDRFFTGEIVDWDSSETQFCGVFGASLTVRGDPARTSTTNPNGRFELTLAPADTTLVDVTPPPDPSECTTGSYTVPAILVASAAVIDAGALVSAREFTSARAPAFGFDATRAQLLVHVDGTPGAVSIDAASDPAQAFAGAWAPGDTGDNVFFPNVAADHATVSMAGAIGTGSVPLAPGTFTWMTLATP